MAYLDYSPVQIADQSEGLRNLGDALTDVMKRREQKRQNEEQMKFQREQEQRRYDQQAKQFEYQNRVEDRKEKMGELEFNQRQQLFKNTQAEAVRKAIADGNIQRAQQIAAETQTFDPHTAAVTGTGSLTQGPGRDIGPAPERPEARELPAPEMSAIMAAVPGMPAAPLQEIEGERAIQGAKMRRFDAQSQAYSEEAKQAEADRPYTLKFGEQDPGVTFDMQKQRYEGRTRAAQDFMSSFRGVPMSETDKAAAMNVAAQIQGGAIDPAKAGAAYDKARMGVVAEEGKNTRSTGRDKAIVDAAKARGNSPSVYLAERRFKASQDKDIRKETRKDVSDWLKANGFETAPKQAAAMDQSIRQLGGNAREQQAALVGMARAVQGDNRFSDQDYRVFVQNGGVGVLDQAENTINKLLDGGYGEQTIAVSSQMAKALRAVFASRLQRAAAEGHDEFVNNEIYDPQVAESVLEQRLGRDYFKRESSRGGPRGGPPEVNAKRKAKDKAGASVKVKAPSVDEALQLLEGAR